MVEHGWLFIFGHVSWGDAIVGYNPWLCLDGWPCSCGNESLIGGVPYNAVHRFYRCLHMCRLLRHIYICTHTHAHTQTYTHTHTHTRTHTHIQCADSFMVAYSDSASHFRPGWQDQSNYNEVADGVVCGSQQRCSRKNTGACTSTRQNLSVV